MLWLEASYLPLIMLMLRLQAARRLLSMWEGGAPPTLVQLQHGMAGQPLGLKLVVQSALCLERDHSLNDVRERKTLSAVL